MNVNEPPRQHSKGNNNHIGSLMFICVYFYVYSSKASSSIADKNPKACVFAAYMIDQSLLQRDMTPLFNVIIEFGTPELWVELVKKVNNAPADRIVEKVYQCDKSVQTYWEQQIL